MYVYGEVTRNLFCTQVWLCFVLCSKEQNTTECFLVLQYSIMRRRVFQYAKRSERARTNAQNYVSTSIELIKIPFD